MPRSHAQWCVAKLVLVYIVASIVSSALDSTLAARVGKELQGCTVSMRACVYSS